MSGVIEMTADEQGCFLATIEDPGQRTSAPVLYRYRLAPSESEKDLLPLLPGGAPLENAFTGIATEPQFGLAAAQPGEGVAA